MICLLIKHPHKLILLYKNKADCHKLQAPCRQELSDQWTDQQMDQQRGSQRCMHGTKKRYIERYSIRILRSKFLIAKNCKVQLNSLILYILITIWNFEIIHFKSTQLYDALRYIIMICIYMDSSSKNSKLCAKN